MNIDHEQLLSFIEELPERAGVTVTLTLSFANEEDWEITKARLRGTGIFLPETQKRGPVTLKLLSGSYPDSNPDS